MVFGVLPKHRRDADRVLVVGQLGQFFSQRGEPVGGGFCHAKRIPLRGSGDANVLLRPAPVERQESRGMDAGRVGDVMYSRLMWPGRAADSAADEVRIEG